MTTINTTKNHAFNYNLVRSICAQLAQLATGRYAVLADEANHGNANLIFDYVSQRTDASFKVFDVGSPLTGLSFDGVIIIRGEYPSTDAELLFATWIDNEVMPRVIPGSSFVASYLLM